MKKISIVASLALAGALSFSIIGCGSSGGSSSSSIKPSNKYVIVSNKPGAILGTDFNKSLVTTDLGRVPSGQNGDYTISFVPALDKDDNVTIAGGWIDVDQDGKINQTAGIDKPLTQTLKAPGDAKYATPLSTLALKLKAKAVTVAQKRDAQALVDASKDFDPVQAYAKAATDNKTKALLMLDSFVTKAADQSSDVYDAITNIDVDKLTSSDENNITQAVDINSSDPKATQIQNALKADAQATAETVKLVQTLTDSGVKPDKAIVVASIVTETDKNVSQAIKETNITVDTKETNISGAIAKVDEAVKNAENNISQAIPMSIKLLNNIISIGGQDVVVDPANKKFANVTVNVNSDTNVTDFYNVKATVYDDSIVASNSGTFDANVTVTVKNNKTGNYLSVSILNGQIVADANANDKLKVVLNGGTSKVVMLNHGITGLSQIDANDGTAQATLNNTLTLTDFNFNVQTLINDLNQNERLVTTLDELNNYLKKDGTYTVTLKIDTDANLELKEATGTVTVKNTEASSPKAGGSSSSPSSTIAYDSSLTNFALNGTLHQAEGNITANGTLYLFKVKTDAQASGTGQNIVLYDDDYNKSIGINNNYPAGTKVQIGIYSNNELVGVSSIYTLTSDDLKIGYARVPNFNLP